MKVDDAAGEGKPDIDETVSDIPNTARSEVKPVDIPHGDVIDDVSETNDDPDEVENEEEREKSVQPVSGTFLTEVNEKAKPRGRGDDGRGEDEELGIYEDTDDGDDLTDTELEIERLRAEKKKREEEEKRKELAGVEKENKGIDKKDETELKNQVSQKDTIEDIEEKVVDEAPQLSLTFPLSRKPETGLDTRLSVKSFQTPKYLQATSAKSTPRRTYQRASSGITNMAIELEESINASRLALESREAMFRRAMTLLSARCNSTKQSDIDSELPFGIQVPKFFYVTQEKPVPMEPLKAWRGYNGNIYFQPISVNHLETNQEEMIRARTSVPRTRNQQRARTTKSLQRIAEKENQPIDSRSDSRQTTKSSVMSKRSTNRQMAVLDKHSVFNNLNEAIHEDIVWLEGQENTGSLAVRPKTYPDRTKEKERDLQYNKERIRKGSVVHKLYVEKGKGKPKFAVSGGKFTPPNSMSPLLRTQTQYSLSHRLTTNSPDPYHLNESKLPPLDQIRASIKHMDTKQNTSVPRGKSYTRSVTLTDDMKPFVKYSPDVVAKFTKQANIC